MWIQPWKWLTIKITSAFTTNHVLASVLNDYKCNCKCSHIYYILVYNLLDITWIRNSCYLKKPFMRNVFNLHPLLFILLFCWFQIRSSSKILYYNSSIWNCNISFFLKSNSSHNFNKWVISYSLKEKTWKMKMDHDLLTFKTFMVQAWKRNCGWHNWMVGLMQVKTKNVENVNRIKKCIME